MYGLDCRSTYGDWVPALDQSQFFRVEQTLGALESNPRYREAASTLFWQVYFNKAASCLTGVLDRVDSLLSSQRQTLSAAQNIQHGEIIDRAFVQLHLATMLLRATGKGIWGSPELYEDFFHHGEGALNVLPVSWYHGYVLVFSERSFYEAKRKIELKGIDPNDLHPEMATVGDTLDPNPELDEMRKDSLAAVAALLFNEGFKMSKEYGQQENALQYFSRAARLWECSQAGLSGELDLKQAAECFEILSSRKWDIKSLENVVHSCDLICDAVSSEFPCSEDLDAAYTIVDFQGREWPASAYWQHAATNALRDAEPELWERRVREQERRACVRRLQKDFFVDDSWSALPEVAKVALVEAEKAWSGEETGREVSTVIQNLQIAMEVCVREFLIKPVMAQFAPDTRIDIMHRGKHALFPDEVKPSDLNLGEMGKLLKHERVSAITKRLCPKNEKDIADVAEESERLWRDRNLTSHPPYSTSYQKMRRHRFAILGIGQPGILPRLLNITRHRAS